MHAPSSKHSRKERSSRARAQSGRLFSPPTRNDVIQRRSRDRGKDMHSYLNISLDRPQEEELDQYKQFVRANMENLRRFEIFLDSRSTTGKSSAMRTPLERADTSQHQQNTRVCVETGRTDSVPMQTSKFISELLEAMNS